MAPEWYVVRGGREIGPFAMPSLKAMADDGRVVPEDRVRRSDMQARIIARSIEGLFPAMPERHKADPKDAIGRLKQTLVARWQALDHKAKIGVAAGGVLACLFVCCGGMTALGLAVGKKGIGGVDLTAGNSGGVKITHGSATEIVMPTLPPDRVIDSSQAPPSLKVLEPAIVPDISKVDFMKGPNGEPIQMVKYGDDYGYFYRNKDGQSVYHGPWHSLYPNKAKKDVTVYIHGAVAFTQLWNEKGLALQQEVFKSDSDHTQRVYSYYQNGFMEYSTTFTNVRYIPTDLGHRVERVAHGLHQYYYQQTGALRQEELFENGVSVGIIIYDMRGGEVTRRGRLGR